jgi:hypothetical protein
MSQNVLIRLHGVACILGGVLYGTALIWLGAFLRVKNTPTSAAFGGAQE